MTTNFPTWAVDGPPPLPPVHGLLQAAEAPAAGVRFVVDTAAGPADENSIASDDAGLEQGLYRRAGGTIWMRQPGGSPDAQVYVPARAGQERWLNGVAVYPYPADVPDGWDSCPGSGASEKSFGRNVTPPEFNALTISEPITCTSRQVPDDAAFKARAVAVLSAVEGYRVARELMGGEVFGSQPFLLDGQGDFPNGDVATRPNHGLQVLEEAIAATGRLGLIHCSPMFATSLLGQGFVVKDVTGVIRTINGIVVIPDFGYVGLGAPTGHTEPGATEEWVVATGPVDIRRSEMFTTPDTQAEALDRGVSTGATDGRPNTLTYRAERYYVASWDTALQASVLVDRCSSVCAVGS